MQLSISAAHLTVGDTVEFDHFVGTVVALTPEMFTVDWFGYPDLETYYRWDAKEKGFTFTANI